MSVRLEKSIIAKTLTAIFISTTLLSGCVSASSKYEQKQVKTAPDYKTYAITIEEGVTTRSEIRSVLGQSHGYLRNNMSYHTRDYKMLIKLKYIDKRGNVFNYQIHNRLPNSHLSITLDDNDVVESIHVF